MSFVLKSGVVNISPEAFNARNGLNVKAPEFFPGQDLPKTVVGALNPNSEIYVPVNSELMKRSVLVSSYYKSEVEKVVVLRAIKILRSVGSGTIPDKDKGTIALASEILMQKGGYNPDAENFVSKAPKMKEVDLEMARLKSLLERLRQF